MHAAWSITNPHAVIKYGGVHLPGQHGGKRCALSGTVDLSGTRGCGGTQQQFSAPRGSRYNN
jgi:hypothetical protein